MEKEPDCLTGPEMEVVTVVFHQFETGLREGTIYCRDLLDAMKALGLNPGEQEVIDMTNEVANNGLVYFPDFCRIVLRKFREENQELFNQQLFKVLCGTDPYPQNFRAKRYRIQEKSFGRDDFVKIMKQLPVLVDEEDIQEMFSFADKNKDGRISYSEFLLMINPPKLPVPPKPSASLRHQRSASFNHHPPDHSKQQQPPPSNPQQALNTPQPQPSVHSNQPSTKDNRTPPTSVGRGVEKVVVGQITNGCTT